MLLLLVLLLSFNPQNVDVNLIQYTAKDTVIHMFTENHASKSITDFDNDTKIITLRRIELGEFKKITPSPTTMQTLKSQDGNFIGYFCIPSVNICVPTYQCDSNCDDATAQWYTDRPNSAAFLVDWGLGNDYLIVADHVNQNFARLNEVVVGSSATIDWYNNTYTSLTCFETGYGINDGICLYDQNGTNWCYWSCDILAYTCVEGSKNGIFYAKYQYN